MKIEKIKLNDIIPTDYNPRTITNEEIIKLQNSINTFGMVDPIIINLKNNHIIGGHQRYNVLQDQYIQNNEFDVEQRSRNFQIFLHRTIAQEFHGKIEE